MTIRHLALAVGLSLSTATAASITLDGDTAATGLNLTSSPLVTGLGTVTLTQNGNFELRGQGDDETTAAGSTGNQFDIVSSALTAPVLNFDFDVLSVTFVYGGNGGGIVVDLLDVNGNVIDTFTQADTGGGQPAGPVTLTGSGIRGLRWNDTEGGNSYAALDNIVLSDGGEVPEPGTFGLLGGTLVGAAVLRRRVSNKETR